MAATKKYYLELSEETYNNLGNDEKLYLNHLGMQVRQLPSEEDLEDEDYKKVRNARLKAWEEEQQFLFRKRNK